MNDKEKVIRLLDLIEEGKAEVKMGQDINHKKNSVLLDGFDDWFDSQCRKHYTIKTSLMTCLVTAFVCVAAWRLSPPVDVAAVDKASAGQRAELVMATKNILNLV